MPLDAKRVIEQLADAGLDLVHAFDAHAIAHADWARLANGPRLGLLVGNTRALWSHFVAARDLLPETDPLDTYVERTIARIIEQNSVDRNSGQNAVDQDKLDQDHVLYAHRTYDGAFLPFQHLAVATGFAALSDGRLAIHPIYGPWFALRAVITIEPAIPSMPAPPMPAPPLPAPIAKPCACTGACAKALDRALGDTNDWHAWLAVRDACSLRAWRYSDEQIRFHYASAWPDAGREKEE